MPQRDPDTGLAALASLTDATRLALYNYVQREGEAVSRDAAAAAVGISRSLAAYHLDRLVDSGLLRVRFARPEGRSGPGAGRPAKLYECADQAVEVSVPRRNYQLAARAFVGALAHDLDEGSRAALQSASRTLGRAMITEGARAGGEDDLVAGLTAMGYQPYTDGATVRLRNCLFADLTRDQQELTCSMNLGLIEGALEALGEDGRKACLDPAEGRCCVAIVADSAHS